MEHTQETFNTPVKDPRFPKWLSDFKIQAIIVGVLAFVFYANTFQNENALDDYMVISKNEYVYEGFAGLPDIFTKDTYDSYWKQMNTSNSLTGGRYRPLSVATFAIEQQFFGTVPKSLVDSVMHHTDWGEMQAHPDQQFLRNMHIRHFFNVLWFTLSVVVLLYFLRYVVFKSDPLIAFLAVMLFTIHPIHTEVVANVKSSDEILSLLFICLTFIFAFKHQEHKEKKWLLYFGLLSYFLAFLSKEYAISLIILLPLSFFLFNKYSFSKSVVASLPYLGVMILYIIIRLQIVTSPGENANSDIINDPYALASASEKLATQIATPLNYLKLLIFPQSLSADYSYNSIPYKDFASPLVWLSILVHLAMIRLFFYYLKRKGVLSFAIAFYLVNLLLICNLIFNIGGTMGERLIYHSSVGFCIAVAYFLFKGAEMIKPALTGRIALISCVFILIIICGFRTIDRNKDWKNDTVLFTHDLEVVPNSLLANSNVAAYMISKGDMEKDEQAKNEDLHKGISLLDKIILINKNNTTSYFNKALAYNKLKMPDSVVATLNTLYTIAPNYPQLSQLYFQAGLLYFSNKEYDKAKSLLQILLKQYPQSIDVQNAVKAVNDSMQSR